MTLLWSAKNALAPAARAALRALRARGRSTLGRHYCPVCEQKVARFAPLPTWYFEQWKKHGYVPIAECDETCNVEAYMCPHCGAADRDRLYALFLHRRLPTTARAGGFSLVDFAPSQPLAAHIRRNYPIRYRTADLMMEGVDDHVDLRRMDIFADQTFDAFICSHVLEHIPEDIQAMAELYRILKPGGWGIVMVPIPCGIDRLREDFTKQTEAERWRHFGQGDHVRIYSRSEFVKRLMCAGFRVLALDHRYFSAKDLDRHGLAPTSTLYVAEKPLVLADSEA